MIFLPDAETRTTIAHSSGQIPECDGRTNRQNSCIASNAASNADRYAKTI